MNSKKPRLAANSDRARLARLTRGELERLLVRAKRAFEAFGTSAGRSEEASTEDDKGSRFGQTPPRSMTATV
jgi:hypothetical protein